MKKQTTRKLQETSWLAQTIADMMDVEIERNGQSSRWNCLNTIKQAVNMADNGSARYDNDPRTGNREIWISYIPSNMTSGMIGLAAAYSEAVTAMTTHDLSSAKINVSKLMEQMRLG